MFPEGTDVTVKHEGDKLVAPGIGDDDRGLAIVLAVARAFEKAGLQTNGTVYFIGNVGEEGPGNLRGTRHLLTKELKGKIDYFISVDGDGLGIASRAVGSNRYRVTYKGPGGHSYGAFGIPNPIHALGRAIAAISDIQVPTTPKTTFNVGVISRRHVGELDPVRGRRWKSTCAPRSAAELATVDAKVMKRVSKTRSTPRMRDGQGRARRRRSSRSSSTRSAFVRRAVRPMRRRSSRPRSPPAKTLGFSSSTGASSTDANIPISLGIPAIRIGGGGAGGGAHALGEWYVDAPNAYLGPQWAALIVAALAGVAPAGVTP